MPQGYYRHPSISRDAVVFVSEDDLWAVPASGGAAKRLTSNLGLAARPQLSPDGKWIAFTGTEEGHAEVYAMPAAGGEARRLTWLGADAVTAGWDREGRILFASNAAQPFLRIFMLYAIGREGGPPAKLPFGPCEAVSFGAGGGVVIGKNMGDPARWKRYRGGTTGDLWVDPEGRGDFRRLLKLPGNLAWPLWIGDRIYFVTDHEGEGNLFSCRPDGGDLRRETAHKDFYVRHPSTDGRRIVYGCGADLWVFDPASRKSAKIAIEYGSPRQQRRRKFAEPARFLEDVALHPEGHSVLITTRGKSFAMPFWEEAPVPVGQAEGARYRLTQWLKDGKRFVTVTDAAGEEAIEVHEDGAAPRVVAAGPEIGRPLDLIASPKDERIVFHNHRFELRDLDLVSGKMRLLDTSPFDRIAGMTLSQDGRWLAYGFASTTRTSQIKVANLETGETKAVTAPDFRDYSPSFDPEGKYLYFLSYRVLDPVYDALYFDLGFPRGTRPYLVTLKKDAASPFVPVKKPVVRWNRRVTDAPKEKEGPPPVEIDFEGIERRIVAFPVAEGRYGRVFGMRGKVAYSNYPIEGALGRTWADMGEPPAKGSLDVWDYEKGKAEPWVNGITDFSIAGDLRTFALRVGNRLRIVGADEKPKEEKNNEPTRETGWLDLSRVRISVTPETEWSQIFREAWRLQRDHFWKEDMGGLDWQGVYERYRPLLDRVGTRGELSDLIWEMQGELGTSHCYEIGGDYRPGPAWRQGFLGADLARGPDGLWKISHLVRGDSWDPEKDSPLARPGVNAKDGEAILSINGRVLGDVAPQEALVHRAGQDVSVTLQDPDGKKRTVVVRTLKEETSARYREWVERNRAKVHADSGGRVGYLHIPNMGPIGYAEFHRYFLAEIDCPGLLIDLRYNGGGHVSQLLLEKLARRRIGYDVARYGPPQPYPSDSPQGPLVALTNEHAGSDGDIFSHCFKLMKLGPLVGKRTWGGVVGIWPRHSLADGTITTQPEFSFWFEDVGYGIENYGTDPDIDVENRPQDWAAGRDLQLERALKEVLDLLEKNPLRKPDLRSKPAPAPPRLDA